MGRSLPTLTAATHRHSQRAETTLRRVGITVMAVLFLVAAEIVTGIRSGSLALLSDAGHLFTDVGTLALAGLAAGSSRRPASARHTYGYHRTGIVVAAVNGAALLGVGGLIAVAAIGRLRHPVAVDAVPVIVVAGVAFMVNTALAILLHDDANELSLRSAALHVIGDALASAGVVVSAVLMLTTGWRLADPVVSLVIAGLIAASATGLLREAIHILSEATPTDVNVESVREAILGTPGVVDVHDLHIWSLSSHHRALSAHVTVGDRSLGEVTVLLHTLEQTISTDFGIAHATLQPECPSCLEGAPLYCDLDNRSEAAAGRRL